MDYTGETAEIFPRLAEISRYFRFFLPGCAFAQRLRPFTGINDTLARCPSPGRAAMPRPCRGD
jgi:hypothetical protein